MWLFIDLFIAAHNCLTSTCASPAICEAGAVQEGFRSGSARERGRGRGSSVESGSTYQAFINNKRI